MTATATATATATGEPGERPAISSHATAPAKIANTRASSPPDRRTTLLHGEV